MTKSSKSKILALALCTGVMSGIYASPVMAADESLANGTGSAITVQDNGGIKVEVIGKHVGDFSIKDGTAHFNYYGEIKANDVVTADGNNLDNVAEDLEAEEAARAEADEEHDKILDEHGKEITAVKEENAAQNEILDEHGKEITAVKEENAAQNKSLMSMVRRLLL